MIVFGIIMITYGIIAITAALLNMRLAWWKQTRPEFVVRALTALGLGIVLTVLGLIE